MTRKQAQRVSEVLFRNCRGTKCDYANLSKRTGIPQSTLYRYRDNPDAMPFGRVLVIADAMQLTAQECAYLLTGKRT